MFKIVVVILGLIDLMIIPFALLLALFSLAAIGNGGAVASVYVATGAIILYPVAIIFGLMRSLRYGKNNELFKAFLINLILSLPVMMAVFYVIMIIISPDILIKLNLLKT
jgi:FlaA1/EpsC-like NDP-sugar epimerase